MFLLLLYFEIIKFNDYTSYTFVTFKSHAMVWRKEEIFGIWYSVQRSIIDIKDYFLEILFILHGKSKCGYTNETNQSSCVCHIMVHTFGCVSVDSLKWRILWYPFAFFEWSIRNLVG